MQGVDYKPTAYEVLAAVSLAAKVTIEDLLRKNDRTPAIAQARMATVVLAYEHGNSLPVIGRAMQRHHTSILTILRQGQDHVEAQDQLGLAVAGVIKDARHKLANRDLWASLNGYQGASASETKAGPAIGWEPCLIRRKTKSGYIDVNGNIICNPW